MNDVNSGATEELTVNSLGAAILRWTHYIMNYIRNVLDWMGRRSGFGRQDVNGLWCDNLGELRHMKR